jgi:alpha-galactosidase
LAKIAIVGAGSMQFTRQVISDLVRFPALQDSSFHLVDIDPERLKVSEGMVRQILKEAKLPDRVQSFPTLKGALTDVDYCINSIQVGGMQATEVDFALPARYGIQQTIADTLGIGGIFRGMRTIPAVLDIAGTLQKESPSAILLNYTNPMSMVMWALGREYPGLQAYGLCHSVYYTAEVLAKYMGVAFDELEWTSAGINHMAWMLTLSHGNVDLYPHLFRCANDPNIFQQDAVRFELMQRLGYFVTESSEHNAEYTSYFIRHPEEVQRLNIPIGEYLRRSRNNLNEFDLVQQALDDPTSSLTLPPSPEYAPAFINARESGTTWWFQGNVINHGLIENLPSDCCVEVPVMVNSHGVFACHVDPLPSALAALNRQAISVQELVVEGVIKRDRDLIYQAAMMDPQISATLTVNQIWHLVDDLFVAHQDFLPSYKLQRLWMTKLS